MHKAVWGLALTTGLGLLIWNSAFRQEAAAQRPPLGPLNSKVQQVTSSQNGLVALGFEEDGATPQVVIVDPQTRAMSVYQIDRTTGEISLKSVRNVRWDLQMEEFNGVSPTPGEIRALLERR